MEEKDLMVAHEIARFLDAQKSDVNELLNCVGFLRNLARDKRGGKFFFDYLDIVIAEGQAVVRSGRTLDYYGAIRNACRQYLKPYQNTPEVMAQILGWAARLMRYHAVEDKLDRQARPPRVRSCLQRPRSTAEGTRRTGTVKWFNRHKGYGFIKPDSGDDVYVHISETPENRGLQSGQRVSFSTEIGPKGMRACNVRNEGSENGY